MSANAIAAGGYNLSALTLDAAIQLDLLSRRQPADTEILTKFMNCLSSNAISPAQGDALNLNERPRTVELFNGALDRMEPQPVQSVSELENRVRELVRGIRDVSTGARSEGIDILKEFCLSLHQAMINESTYYGKNEEEWILRGDERFA